MKAAYAIFRKDLLLELRGKEIVITLTVFAFLVLTVFSFSAVPGSTAPREMAPGILWITFLFAGILGLGRAFDRERENGCFTGLLLAPCDRMQVYWGKCLSTLVLLMIFQAILWPIFGILYRYSPIKGVGVAWAGIVLGDIGFVALGVILSAVTIHARGREIILPLLLLPLSLPVLVGGVRVLTLALGGGSGDQALTWIGRLAAFDVIFLVLGSVLFPLVVEE
ncbi:MAG: heme exporter protein CcmB [bacterium]|nr:heme exporter protein CcmB [bacterium]MDT8366556.1 heme exporter protein CcmB [bacterium]